MVSRFGDVVQHLRFKNDRLVVGTKVLHLENMTAAREEAAQHIAQERKQGDDRTDVFFVQHHDEIALLEIKRPTYAYRLFRSHSIGRDLDRSVEQLVDALRPVGTDTVESEVVNMDCTLCETPQVSSVVHSVIALSMVLLDDPSALLVDGTTCDVWRQCAEMMMDMKDCYASSPRTLFQRIEKMQRKAENEPLEWLAGARKRVEWIEWIEWIDKTAHSISTHKGKVDALFEEMCFMQSHRVDGWQVRLERAIDRFSQPPKDRSQYNKNAARDKRADMAMYEQWQRDVKRLSEDAYRLRDLRTLRWDWEKLTDCDARKIARVGEGLRRDCKRSIDAMMSQLEQDMREARGLKERLDPPTDLAP